MEVSKRAERCQQLNSAIDRIAAIHAIIFIDAIISNSNATLIFGSGVMFQDSKKGTCGGAGRAAIFNTYVSQIEQKYISHNTQFD